MTDDEVRRFVNENSNWGRWGPDGALGAAAQIGSAKRLQAAGLVRTGRSFSLSRKLTADASRAEGLLHDYRFRRSDYGHGIRAQGDSWRIDFHGLAMTHIDALNHIEFDGRLWDGREAAVETTDVGCMWGDVDRWGDGIVTRGVLLDIPALRSVEFVAEDEPVLGSELEAAASRQAVEVSAGDALIVHCGREAWSAANPPFGSRRNAKGEPITPGLDASCLQFIRKSDVSVLVWDMIDALPGDGDMLGPVHLCLNRFGVALVDNALLGPFAAACAAEKRYEFMIVLAPLRIIGGTGSPINPIVVM